MKILLGDFNAKVGKENKYLQTNKRKREFTRN
jgi:hypothetical protein